MTCIDQRGVVIVRALRLRPQPCDDGPVLVDVKGERIVTSSPWDGTRGPAKLPASLKLLLCGLMTSKEERRDGPWLFMGLVVLSDNGCKNFPHVAL